MRRFRISFAAVVAATLAASSVQTAQASVVSQNLGAAAYSASSTFGPGFEAELAFDGNSGVGDPYWNSGTGPVGWIEVNLGQQYSIESINLVAAQLPPGDTEHEIWFSNSAMQGDLSGATLYTTLTGPTADLSSITALSGPGPFPTAQYIQVRTTSSPSWVAWREITVNAESAAVPEPTSLALCGFGVMSMGVSALRRRRKAVADRA